MRWREWLIRTTSTFVLFVFLLGAVAPQVEAASAQLTLSASKRTAEVGERITVTVGVNTGGMSINAASARISFDEKKLSVVSASRAGSVFTLWAEEPTSSNSSGTVSFGGGLPNPGFTGSGALIRITFQTKAVGVASIRFSSGTVLANDGLGTNVLAGLGALDITVNERGASPAPAPTPTPAPPKPSTPSTPGSLPVLPQLASTSHPDETRWYAQRRPVILWELPREAIATSVTFDQLERGDAGTKPLATLTNFTSPASELADGVWYAHVRLQNVAGWGPVATYRFNIDGTPPVIASLATVRERERLQLQFSATDEQEVDRVAVAVDGKQLTDKASTGYILPEFGVGDHRVVVTVYDVAGNTANQELLVSVLHEGSSPLVVGLATAVAALLAVVMVLLFWRRHDIHHEIMAGEFQKTRRDLKAMGEKLERLEEHLRRPRH